VAAMQPWQGGWPLAGVGLLEEGAQPAGAGAVGWVTGCSLHALDHTSKTTKLEISHFVKWLGGPNCRNKIQK